MYYLLSTAFVLSPLFPATTPMAKKIEALTPYFSPQPGQEIATIDKIDRLNHKGEVLDIPGYVWVRPPSGHCFVVTQDPHRLDKPICKPTKLKFTLRELTQSGKFTWKIVQSDDDEGTPLTWQTPYRLANFVPLGDFKLGNNLQLPIAKCEASFDGISRKVVLTFFDERQWFIHFPDKDLLLEEKQEEENLYVRKLTSDKSLKGTGKTTKKEVKRRNSILSAKLSGKLKKKDNKAYPFLTKPWEGYQMNSGHVLEVGGPVGINGLCRYRFSGAWLDQSSGILECFDTDNYDALYTHLPCSSSLPERPTTATK